jgi:hypothetical protein
MADNKKRKKKKVSPKTTTKVNINKRGLNVQRKHKPSGVSYGVNAGKGHMGVNISLPITLRSKNR